MGYRADRAGRRARTTRVMCAALVGLVATIATATTSAAELSLRDDEYVVFHHHDALGSPVATTDEHGEALWYEYTEPFGRSHGRRDTENDRLDEDPLGLVEEGGHTRPAYTGHVRDGASGLIYMQARHYDPELGRFLSIDPIGFVPNNPASFNRYAYANNNPYAFVDPDGRWAILALAVFGGGLTAYETYDTYRSEGFGAAARSASIGVALTAATGGLGKMAGSLGKRMSSFMGRGDATAASSAFSMSSSQLGAKLGRHAQEFGLDPSNSADRDRLADIIEDIATNPDRTVPGTFAGQGPGGSRGPVEFRIQGNDVVVTGTDGTFITVLKDGVNNTSVQNAVKAADE